MTTEELIRKVGDPETLSQELRQADADSKALEARWEQLVSDYPEKWVAVLHGEFLIADSLNALISEAAEKGWDVGAMVVDRLVDERRTLLF